MKHQWLLSALMAGLFITAASAQDSTSQRKTGLSKFGKFLEKSLSQPTTTGTGSPTEGTSLATALSSNDIAAGLKEALRVGIDKGASQASAIDGYFKNPVIKILFPPEAQKVESRLRQLGFNKQVDQFELSMNRAAEGAAKKAKPVFIKAITSMSITDAVGILRGQPDAATQYLRKTTGTQLQTEFTPIIDSTLKENNATKYYASLVNTYNKLPFIGQKVNPNLTQYATQKAVDGLFVLVANEEKNIRANPAARATDLLKRVFSR